MQLTLFYPVYVGMVEGILHYQNLNGGQGGMDVSIVARMCTERPYLSAISARSVRGMGRGRVLGRVKNNVEERM